MHSGFTRAATSQRRNHPEGRHACSFVQHKRRYVFVSEAHSKQHDERLSMRFWPDGPCPINPPSRPLPGKYGGLPSIYNLQLARSLRLRLNVLMRGWTVIVLLGLTAIGAYSVGRQDGRPSTSAPAMVAQLTGPPASPLALTAVPGSPSQPQASKTAPPGPRGATAIPKTLQDPAPQQTDTKRKIEVALTAAAIAAILIKASRDQYHATGRPCACPDDTMRNGRACGSRSAYSRPGGAAPLCYLGDVTTAMIDEYRKKITR
jgi:hypothetical protein